MSQIRLECHDVEFRYPKRSRPAIAGISLALRPGITGLIGANGAGKSTLLQLAAGLLKPRRGAIHIDGLPVETSRRLGNVALLPETPLLDAALTVRAFLDGLAALAGCESRSVEVADLAAAPLLELSLGQKRRVELAAALTADPNVLLLDEPTNGLDPLAIRQLRERLQQLNDGARVIVVSSHHLDELQRITDHIVGIRAGSVVGQWEMAAAVTEFGSLDALFHAALADAVLENH